MPQNKLLQTVPFYHPSFVKPERFIQLKYRLEIVFYQTKWLEIGNLLKTQLNLSKSL